MKKITELMLFVSGTVDLAKRGVDNDVGKGLIQHALAEIEGGLQAYFDAIDKEIERLQAEVCNANDAHSRVMIQRDLLKVKLANRKNPLYQSDLNAKVTAPAWAGEGLPPVVMEIEAMMKGMSTNGTYAWRRALVVHGPLPDAKGEVLVFDVETTRPAWADEFRPIRIAEQIAAEEREAKIQELSDAAGLTVDGYRSVFEKIIDAGYCKRVQP